MRINARLDDERTEKLEFLKTATHATVTGVVEAAIDRYDDDVRAQHPPAAATLRRHGFVGGFEADPDLASNAKQALIEVLESKHGDR